MIERKHPLARCEECPLFKERVAPTSGPADAKIAVVSRSPGMYDVGKKRPFAGPSGKILDHLLGLYGVKRDDIRATNVVLCKTEVVPKEAISACAPRLRADLDNVDTIIACGSEAVGTIIGAKSLDGTRGYVHERTSDSGRNQRVIASNNPAVVLRDDSTFPNLVKDFRLALAPRPVQKLPEVNWTNDVSTAKRWIRAVLEQRGSIAVDIESRGLAHTASLASIAFSVSGAKALAFGSNVVREKTFLHNYLRPALQSKRVNYLWHNGKFDVRNLRNKGINARVDEDTLLLSWVCDERSDESQVHSLDYLVMDELGWPHYEPKEVKEWKARVRLLEKQLRYKELEELDTPDSLYEYNAYDAAGTRLLFPILATRARDESVLGIYKTLLLRASEALVRVELAGADYDTERAADLLEEEVWPKLDGLRAELQLIIGDGSYNPNSADQNSKLVYDEWRVLHNLKLKNDRSVDKSVYTEIKRGRFVIAGMAPESVKRPLKETATRWATVFADYKELEKQRSTYIEGLIPRAAYFGGRLYTDFKLHNTVSGRLSSSRPNLQNVTRPKPGLPNIRALFVATPGNYLLQADYSQAELRTIAMLSGDAELTRIYRDDLDLHSIAAERFYGVGFSKEQRVRAKNMNFGVAYGQTAETFQEKHDIPVDEGKAFIEWWWRQFPAVRAWSDAVAKQVLTVGEVVSPFGNKRRFHLITKENKNASVREGVNFLPQSIAAYFTLWSLCDLVIDLFDPMKAEVILTVHDSIVVRVKEDYVPESADAMKSVMRKAPRKTLDWKFPYDADVQIGTSWGYLEDLELTPKDHPFEGLQIPLSSGIGLDR